MVYSLTWLPEVLEQAGLKVAETADWRTRGRGEMGAVRGVMCHHTATAHGGNMPTLNLLISGRAASSGAPALSGPLAQLGLGRDGTYYIVAAGRANHAGAGTWEGLTTGNSSFIGIEAENDGVGEVWPDVQMDAYRRSVAAILKKIGAGANMCCGHKEYAPHRKSDPDFDMPTFRNGVAAFLTGKTPPPLIPATDDQQRPTLRRGLGPGPLIAQMQGLLNLPTTGSFDAQTEAAVRAFQRTAGLVPDGIVGPKTWQKLDAPPLLLPAPAVGLAAVPAGPVPSLPPADDENHRPKVLGRQAMSPDGKPFAVVSGLGFQTIGQTSLQAWLASLSTPPSVSPSVIRTVAAMSANEGRLEAINSYDDAHLSFGMFQWTAGESEANGELAALLAKLKTLDSDAFEACFGIYGLDAEVVPATASTGSISLKGQVLKSSEQKDVLRNVVWAYRFWRAGHHPAMRLCEFNHAVSRIELFKTHPTLGRPLVNWVSSELGIALVLDEHVNRPGHVPGTLERAIRLLGNGKVPDPTQWTTSDENALIKIYLNERNGTMTASQPRADKISQYVKLGKLSDHRDSFIDQ